MASLNKVTLIGNVGRDPEIIKFTNGDSCAKFSIATTEKWKSKDGEQKEKTEWHNVEVFDGVVKVVQDYVTKGKQLYIEGQLRTDEYEKDGVKKYATKSFADGAGSSSSWVVVAAAPGSLRPRRLLTLTTATTTCSRGNHDRTDNRC
jgi:single stranded DNA-binding protein